MNELIEESLGIIRFYAHKAVKPAVMLSFGKDSMVLASLIRQALLGEHSLNGQHFPLASGFPLPVVYHRDPWFHAKHDFADQVSRSWGMEIHDYPPFLCGIKTNENILELVARYPFGQSAIDIPKNVCRPDEYPRRDFICSLHDWMFRPRGTFNPQLYPWDTVFMGHKSSDVDEFEGRVPLKANHAIIGGIPLVFPLRSWADEDVWAYIDENHVPVQPTRYQGHKEAEDKWYSNDYIHACTACVDPRNPKTVFCPKLKRDVPNVGELMLELRADTPYIEREKQNANSTTTTRAG
jgi:3'-phosphoadenosine 5'-phosphosulfate sulfotransferase (PAPS reductase)/FAD synthetase